MKRPTEQELARHYLAHRNRGYSVAYVIRKSRVSYAILTSAFLVFIVGYYSTKEPSFEGLCLWGGGMFFGALLRDAGLFRRIKRQWPFTQKIINWPKVEDIAEGRDSANDPQDGTT